MCNLSSSCELSQATTENDWRLYILSSGATSKGLTTYVQGGRWTMKGVGYIPVDNDSIVNDYDKFHFTYIQDLTNDYLDDGHNKKGVDVRIRVESFSGQGYSRAGLMIRNTQHFDSGDQDYFFTAVGENSVQMLSRNGGIKHIKNGNVQSYADPWLRIVKGDCHNIDIGKYVCKFTSYYSTIDNPTADEDWTLIGEVSYWNWDSFHVGVAIGTAESKDEFTFTDFTMNGNEVVQDKLTDNPRDYDVALGFTMYKQRVCKKDNQFIEIDRETFISYNEPDSANAIKKCSLECDSEPKCLSFDIVISTSSSQTCRLSSSCNHYISTEKDGEGLWYFKHMNIAPPGYSVYSDRKCTRGMDDRTKTFTAQECANLCSTNQACELFSYGYAGVDDDNCFLSLADLSSVESDCDDLPQWNLFVKKDADDHDDNGECPVMPFAQAEVSSEWRFLYFLINSQNDTDLTLYNTIQYIQTLTFISPQEYCENAGGYLCSKEELGNHCASFMGCGFDDSQVWSSTEADPIKCDDIVSYQMCNEFIEQFDRLYDARNTTVFPEGNPLSNVPNEEADLLNNIRFPTDYNWDSDKHGVRGIIDGNSYLYEYESILTKDESYCDTSILGPPSLLAQACDESMSFLLGHVVSLGLLKSTANAVNGK